MTDKKGLIEELARLAGCTYVSDLHLSSAHRQVRRAAEKIEKGRYSAVEWCEACEYITGDKACCSKREGIEEKEVRRRISEALGGSDKDAGTGRPDGGRADEAGRRE